MIVRNRMNAPERREVIVEAAFRIFAVKGFRGTATRELAPAAIIDARSREDCAIPITSFTPATTATARCPPSGSPPRARSGR